jgi:hypothetical protein
MRVALGREKEWRAAAYSVVPLTWPDFPVSDPSGHRIVIRPFAGWYADLTVLGGDWVPISAQGEILVDHMVHTPPLYLDRRRVRSDGDGWSVEPGEILSCEMPAVLLGGSGNYYHWLMDSLPRIMLLGRERFKGLRIVVQSELNAFQLDSLDLLGIDRSRLLRVTAQQSVRVKTLLLSNLLASTTVVHPKVPGLLRTLLPAQAPSRKDRRIFLSRRDAGRRRLINEAELLVLLARWGFEVHVPGEMSFDAQMQLCSQASVICALHGAALANMVFAPQGCHVIEVTCAEYRVSSMKILARMCSHTYACLNARVVAPSADGNPLLGDWLLDDLDAVEAELRRCLS